MTTYGEQMSDGIPKCSCGCTDIVVEMTNYYYIERNKNLEITNEYEGADFAQDIKITCRKCEKNLEM